MTRPHNPDENVSLPPSIEDTTILGEGKREIPEASAVVDQIFEDLRDRSFLKWMFDRRGSDCFIGRLNGDPLHGIDLEAQGEIHKAWEAIVQAAILAERNRCAGFAADVMKANDTGSGFDSSSAHSAAWRIHNAILHPLPPSNEVTE